MNTLERIDAARAVDALEDIFVIFDQSGTLIEWNKATIEVTGYDADQLATMGPLDFFDHEDISDISEAIETAQQTGSVTIEGDLVTAGGDQVPYEFAVNETTDVGGETVYICVGRDISDRVRVQRQRQEILDRMSDAFFAVDENWIIQYANSRAKRILTEAMTNTDHGQIVGTHLWTAIPEATDTTFYEKYHQAMETLDPVSFEEYYEPLDTWFDVRVHPSESGLSIYLFDITEQKAQREELRHRQKVLRRMYEIISDRGRTFEDQVKALLQLGRQEFDVSYGTLSQIRGEEYVFEIVDAATEAIQSGDTVPLSATNCEIAATNEETLVLGNIPRDAPEETDRAGYTEWGISCYIGSPVYVDEQVYGTFCFYDETAREDSFSEWEVTLVDMMARWVSYELARRRARERLERQNENLEQFASIVSHDLKNPLNALSGWIEMAEQTGDADAFDRCHRTIERMNTLVDDLLELARAGTTILDTEPVDVQQAVTECLDGVPTGEAHISIETEQVIQADESRFKQLFENLLRNAIEHGGPAVEVTVGSLPDGFYIEDDGPGIPPDKRDEVFERGYSTTEDGTGFGLAIVKEIANAHDWSVELTESEHGGARFEFTNVGTVSAD